MTAQNASCDGHSGTNATGTPDFNGTTADGVLKPRIVVMSDITSAGWEPDDMQSFIHLLASADMFEIDGIISTTGWSLDGATPLQTHHFYDVIDAYEQDLPNLMKRSGQKGFLKDESRQSIGYWPSPAYLRNVVTQGQPRRGMGAVGDGKSTPGSRQVTEVVDHPDARPVWILFWGGGNTLAQAIWDVRQTRTAAQLNEFLAKIRVYAITDQDRGFDGEGYENSSQFWMRQNFEFFYIWSESAWQRYGSQLKDLHWSRYTEQIQGHGALGGMYPTWKFIVEGDTPSFLYLWPGVNNPEDPSQQSYGGRFVVGTGPDGQTRAYVDHSGDAANRSRAAVDRYIQDQINDFVSRIDWATHGTGNRNPRLIVNDDAGYAPVVLDVGPGGNVAFSAEGSRDPDGDGISYGWSQDTGAGYSGEVTITGADTMEATVRVPLDAAGQDINIIARAVANGAHTLSSYRRIILRVS